MSSPDEPDEPDAQVTMTSDQIERALANFVAGLAGVPAPFVYHIRWLWNERGPLAHLSIRRAPPTVVRFERRKKESPR